MAGPIHGLIENFNVGTSQGTGSCQAFFVNVYNFLNNNTGTLGIQRIAYNTGSNIAGMPVNGTRGMQMYPPNSQLAAGHDAWACFCFSSASKPWYVFMQGAFGSNLGSTNAGSPALVDSLTTFAGGVGFSFAQSVSGSNPWNGTSGSLGTGSAGTDTKGNPVWVNGTNSSIIHYPRSNDPIRAGGTGVKHENLIGFTVGQSEAARYQILADYDNFCIVYDTSNDGTYDRMLFFGTYTPLSGLSSPAPDLPYFCMYQSAVPFNAGQVYGTVAGATMGGGTSYPQVAVSGSCTVALERLALSTGLFQNTNAQPNRAFATPRWDEWPILVGLYEFGGSFIVVGPLGQHVEFMREVYNIPTHDTSLNLGRAVFGSSTQASVHVTLPWNGSTIPGSGATLTGVTF